MKKTLLVAAMALLGTAGYAQGYITAAPEGGFNVADGKDYVVLYAPEDVISKMGSKVITNNNLDQTQEKNYLEYWVTDWDKKDLTLYNVPEEGGKNSFGTSEYTNATPLYEWGTGVFVAKSESYDLSKVTDEHHIHIGLRDFGSTPSKYKFQIGSQKTIKQNGFSIEVGVANGDADGEFVGVGQMPNGNDGKWYYLDIPVKDLVDENGDYGFIYDFSAPITDGAFLFQFNSPTVSTAKKTGPAPGESVYTYEITKLGSALSIDHVFFYVPEGSAGLNDVVNEAQNQNNRTYNLQGIEVGSNYKGIVIKNGRKMIQK